MNFVRSIEWLPAPELFVAELAARVGSGYPKATVPICTAIRRAGAAPDRILAFARDPLARAHFLLGCCAEEIAALEGRLDRRREAAFLRTVVARLRPHARPIPARRISPLLRRLVAAFRADPARTRFRTVLAMLEATGNEDIAALLAADAAAPLAIECSVTVDGIAGTLLRLVEERREARLPQALLPTGLGGRGFLAA